MKPWERKIAPVGFLAAGALNFFVAFAPTFKGQPMKVAFLPIGILCLIMGKVTWRKTREHVQPTQ